MNKQLGLLFLITVLALGLGVWLTQNVEHSAADSVVLFDKGFEKVPEVTALELKNSQGNLLQAKLVDGQWMAKLNEVSPMYPLDKSKLANFFNALVHAKLLEAKTSKKENYHHLGVESIDDMDSLATLVSLSINGESEPWSVLIGNKVDSGQGNYVRRPTSLQSWKIDKTIELPDNAFAWLLRPALPLNETDIRSVSRIDRETWTIVKTDDDEKFALETLPAGRELRYPGIVEAMVSSLLELDFEAVLPLDDARWQNAQVIAKLSILTQDNQGILAQVALVDGDYLLQFSSEKMSGTWLNWTYQITSFTAQQLIKSNEDFLTALPEKAKKVSSAKADIEEGESPN